MDLNSNSNLFKPFDPSLTPLTRTVAWTPPVRRPLLQIPCSHRTRAPPNDVAPRPLSPAPSSSSARCTSPPFPSSTQRHHSWTPPTFSPIPPAIKGVEHPLCPQAFTPPQPCVLVFVTPPPSLLPTTGLVAFHKEPPPPALQGERCPPRQFPSSKSCLTFPLLRIVLQGC
jgi:hypothetical protein